MNNVLNIEAIKGHRFSMRAHIALVVTLLLGMFLQGLLFVVNVSCSAYPMIISFGAASLIMLVFNRRCLVRFVVLTLFVWVLTAYTFSYTGTDALSCHFPMQDLLRRGWNPLYVATIDSFSEMTEHYSLAKYHILFMPKAAALCGALVASATGLFAADAFLQHAFLVMLMFLAYDFSRRYFAVSRILSCLFSFSIVSATRITSILAGQIDYLVYAEIIAMMLSLVLYVREKKIKDLLVFTVSLSLALLTKPNAMSVGLATYFCALPFLRKDRRFLIAGAFTLVAFLVIGASPYITSAIYYSSPFYPAHSFSAAHPVLDLTSDFTCNADGATMGHLSRWCYAWISPGLTKKLCSIWYGVPDFNPVFSVVGGVGGFGGWFRCLLLLSLVALVFSKKNEITFVCLFLLVMSMAVPVKYIGYSRYFPYVWVVPILAFLNFCVNPVARLEQKGARLMALVRAFVAMIPVAIALFSFSRALAYYGRSVAIETVRQELLKSLRDKSAKWRICGGERNSYSLVRRLQAGGIDCRVDDDIRSCVPVLTYEWEGIWIADGHGENWEEVKKEYFIADTPKALLAFPWGSAYKCLFSVSVLWGNSKSTMQDGKGQFRGECL